MAIFNSYVKVPEGTLFYPRCKTPTVSTRMHSQIFQAGRTAAATGADSAEGNDGGGALQPFGDGLYNPSVVILRMVYYWVYHITVFVMIYIYTILYSRSLIVTCTVMDIVLRCTNTCCILYVYTVGVYMSMYIHVYTYS